MVTIRAEFREAQDEVLARPLTDVVRVDIERALLLPLLRLPVGEAAGPLRRFFTKLSGPADAVLGDLGRLLGEMAEPTVRPDHLGVEVDDPELTDLSRMPSFDDAIWDLAEGMLADLDEPTRLSAVLARTADEAPRCLTDLTATARRMWMAKSGCPGPAILSPCSPRRRTTPTSPGRATSGARECWSVAERTTHAHIAAAP